MNIDKRCFLRWVAAMATGAAACADPASDGQIEGTTTATGSSAGPGSSTADDSTGASPPADSSTGRDNTEATTTSETSDGGLDATGSTETGSTTAGEDADGGDPGCYGRRGPVVDCAPAADSQCASALDWCTSANAAYKPGVAAAAAQCIVDLPTQVSCGAVTTCNQLALWDACSDMSANPLCGDLVTACKGTGYALDHVDCHLVVDGLNELGRAELHACVTEQDCAIGVGPCIESLGLY